MAQFKCFAFPIINYIKLSVSFGNWSRTFHNLTVNKAEKMKTAWQIRRDLARAIFNFTLGSSQLDIGLRNLFQNLGLKYFIIYDTQQLFFLCQETPSLKLDLKKIKIFNYLNI